MTKEEKEAHEEELNNEVKKIFDDETAFVNKIFVDERNTLIPVAFAEEFFYENGLKAYDKLVAEKVAFASHPALKQAREIVAFTMAPAEKMVFIGQQFTDLEMAAPECGDA